MEIFILKRLIVRKSLFSQRRDIAFTPICLMMLIIIDSNYDTDDQDQITPAYHIMIVVDI